MADRLRCTGNRYFVWLEFEDMRDGIAFAMAFQGMGWRNLLHELDMTTNDQKETVFEDENRTIQARLFTAKTTNGPEQGVLWIPGEADEFTRQWLRKPGVVSSPKHTLVFGDEADARWADLVVLSGHGSKGRVYGEAYGRLMKLPAGQKDRKWYVANIMEDTSTPRGKRLKYLLLPCCSNAGIGVAPMWLPMFRNRPADQVIHGILGYAQAYPGDETGAIIMRRFVSLLFPELVDGAPKNEKTILRCWAEANQGYGWGAVMIEECAKADKMSAWVSSAGLSDPREIKVKQYDGDSTDLNARPNLDDGDGILVTDQPPDFKATFWLTGNSGDDDKVPQTDLQEVDGLAKLNDGVELISCGNNDNYVWPSLGLDQGRLGKLVLSAKSGTFAKGTRITVLFYLYREAHLGMDLSRLLRFELSPSQKRRLTFLAYANRRKEMNENLQDAFNYVFDDGDEEAQWELKHGRVELFFQVNPKADQFYTDTTTTGHSRGYFWLDVIPPWPATGANTSLPKEWPKDAKDRPGIVWVLTHAIHLVPQGVHLRVHAATTAGLQGWRPAYEKLRAAYEAGFKAP